MAKDFFNEDQRKLIVDAIKQAELDTSGEIRVHLDKHCDEDVLDRAAHWFEKLQMHKTEQRNGVLFYLAYEDHKFAVLGDAGINQKVPEDFWNSIKNLMVTEFKEGRFAEGLANGIIESGKQLKKHFPYQTDDVNELSDDISFGDK
ncbi:TPM domain-containing protein [Carboxylicivirga marina]|uniref:TPM domain-containing protein n=1 Tax=Carboxylicivirga marina TaxID=2800988 RepID=A0ABS1HMJ6_9BACT|nr:TPM domain-containing protein [Carboxylicivirga marina]MBK3518840.1 TPM domain-containing protein [Carboxylicivirga marina]